VAGAILNLSWTFYEQNILVTYSVYVMIRKYSAEFKFCENNKANFSRFMFHQANMRQGDTPFYTVGPLSGNLSLLQIGTETLVQELMRL
jgi:hypothetical protein